MQKTALGIFFIIFVILLVINVFAFKIFESASQPITFENLLTELSHAPQIDMTLADTMEEFKVNYNTKPSNKCKYTLNSIKYIN